MRPGQRFQTGIPTQCCPGVDNCGVECIGVGTEEGVSAMGEVGTRYYSCQDVHPKQEPIQELKEVGALKVMGPRLLDAHRRDSVP